MPKSVAIIGTRGYPSYYGGFETAVRRLAPYLANNGWDVTVYSRPDGIKTNDPGLDPRVTSVLTRGIETKQLSTLSYGLTSTVHAAAKKPDVALIMNVANGYFLPLLKARGIPTILNVDGIEWERAKWGKAARKLFRQGARASAITANYLIADAKEIRRRWESKTHRKLEFIPYGGDEPGDLPAPLEGTPGKYALLVARFVPENTIGPFLDAARTIAKTHDVILVGSAGYTDPIEDKVRALVDDSPRVKWLGHISNDEHLHALWQSAGVYFHGHSVGGTNPALVQAMACSTPTVARDTVYNREVLDGAALFVQPNGEDIAVACLKVLNDPSLRRDLGAKAHARSRSHYSWEQVCADYEALLNRAIEEGSRHIKF